MAAFAALYFHCSTLCLFCQELVPETGLEPARLAAYAPKAYVYTNFTTRATVLL